MSLVFFSLVGVICATAVLAVNEDNVGGFAWSENIGWISFNNETIDGVPGGGGAKDYGVGVNESTGAMSGYAWSENIGWISFNAADVAGCPLGTCAASVSTVASGGNYYLSGWARAIAARDEASNSGGWDGFIKLDGSYIGSNGDFHGWMTGSADATTGVVGWVNLNSTNCNGSNCVANASYKVHTAVTFGPVAAMECGGNCPGEVGSMGYCDSDPNSTWIMYTPSGDCPTCAYRVDNVSTGDFCTKWELVNGSNTVVYESGPWDGGQTLTFDGSVPAGDYTLRLRVSDVPRASNNSDCSLGLTDVSEHDIEIRQEADAAFMCSLDDPAVVADPVWIDCESTGFKKKVMKEEKIFVTDSAALAKHSEASESATQIDSREWSFTIDGSDIDGGTGTGASFTAGKSNILKLEISDDASRTNCQIINFNGKSLPKWQEVNPVSMMVDNLYADLSKAFAGIVE